MNIRNVLVPVDFSPPSRLAVDYGISLARQVRSTLTLLHVSESPFALTHPFRAENASVEKAHREQALRMLSALVASEDQDDLDLRTVVKPGEVKEQIMAAIGEQGADVVVMGAHGRGFFGRLVIGSITEAILRKAPVPVLTIARAVRPLSMKRILFATDLSEFSKGAFGFALDLAQAAHSTVVLLHVLDRVTVAYDGAEMVHYVSEGNIEEAKGQLAELAAEAAVRNIKTESLVVEGAAAEEILKAIGVTDADLLLMSVGRKGLVERALLGATAERVIREAAVPVLSIPEIIRSGGKL